MGKELGSLDNKPDQVKQPVHYMLAPGMEAIDVIEAAVKGKDGFEAFCVGSALKYLLRSGKKGPAETDYRKARQYLDFLIEGRKA